MKPGKLSTRCSKPKTQYIKIVDESFINADLINAKQHQLEAVKEELTVTKAQVCFRNTHYRIIATMHFFVSHMQADVYKQDYEGKKRQRGQAFTTGRCKGKIDT